MTVKDFILENPDMTLHLMTPAGYVDLNPEQTKSLLAGNNTMSHPGCSGCDMELPADVVLSQFICSCNMDQENHQCYMLTATDPPEEDIGQKDENDCLAIQMM